MRRFAHAAVLAVAISAPVLAGALVDHSVVSVLGKTGGGCSSNCSVGGAAPGSSAQGGHRLITTDNGLASRSSSGTGAVPGGQTTGHSTETIRGNTVGTASGNFDTVPSSKGHCTGVLSRACS